MMNKNKIKVPTAIPAQMFDFKVNASNHLTSAKLKVLHADFTVDGRIFTSEMIEGIKNSIGGTPIVAFYDEEAQDFIGHYSEQSVFGYVPEDAAVEVKAENGREWLETEVKLFTRRHDVGRVAKQIIGKQQSLELDPSTTEFEVVLSEDPERKFDIVYKSGELIGLSVLGDYQSPAFNGSTFFEESEENDDEVIKEIIAKFNELPKEVEVEIHEDLFAEKDEKNRDGETDPIEEIVEVPEEPSSPEPVEPEEPEDPEEPDEDPANTNTDGEEDPSVVEPSEEDSELDGTLTDEVGEEEADLSVTEDPASEDVSEEFTEEPSEVETDEIESEGDEEVNEETATETEIQEVGVEPEAEEVDADAFALNKAEREELENYRREHKVRIINEYEEFLSTEDFQDFIENVDKYELSNIEKELSFASMQFLRSKADTTTTFMFNTRRVESTNKPLDPLEEAIRVKANKRQI